MESMMWEMLTQCERLHYLSGVGKYMMNHWDLSTENFVEVWMIVFKLTVEIHNSGCWTP